MAAFPSCPGRSWDAPPPPRCWSAVARQPRQPPDQDLQAVHRRQRLPRVPDRSKRAADRRRPRHRRNHARELRRNGTAAPSRLGRTAGAALPLPRQAAARVDVVLERHDGDVAGIEIEASATPTTNDFAGLRYLRDKLVNRFKHGVVLHIGADTLPFGDRLAAVPGQVGPRPRRRLLSRT